jgi:hypothetical protein
MALSQAAQAQVGIRSGSAQLTLIARSAPHASIRTVEPARQIGRSGTLVEASTLVRWSANTGHRLLVRGGAPASRIWVQDLNGVYQELTGASSVTVARHQHGGGQWERQVRYRVEASGNGELAGPLQVQYEIAVNPAI